MKKLFTLLTAVLFVGTLFATDPVSTLTFTAKCNGSGTADDNAVWTVTSDANESTFDATKGIHYGTSNVAVSYITLTTSDIQGTIKEIVVNTSGASGVSANVSVTVGETSFTTGEPATTSAAISSTATNYTFTGSASGEIVVNVAKPSSATGALYVKSIAVTYEAPAAPPCATPTFSPAAGAVLSGTTVTISSATEGATIYYTMGATPADPTTGSDQYTEPIQITEATTIKAIAVKDGYTNSAVRTAAYTIATPLTTMDEIFAVAEAAGTKATDKYITFNNWVVSGKTTNTAYVTDGTKGFVINIENHGYSVGDILSGTANVSLKLTSGRATISAVSGTITKTEGGVITPVVVDINDLSGVNTGAPIIVQNVIYDGTYLVDASSNTIKPYKELYSEMSFTKGNTYNVKGIYLQYGNTKEILPREAGDIEEAAVQIPVVYLNTTSKNVAAIDVEEQSVAWTKYHLEDISSVNADLYSDAACTIPITSDAWIKNITVNNEKTGLTFNVDDSYSAQRTCYLEITVSDGTSNASAVLPITQAKSNGPASLPFSFDGGKSDIESIIGLSQSGLGSDYTDSPKLKFDGTKDSLLLKINETPGTLSFDIVGKSFSEGTFKVQTSADGVAYTDLKSYTELTSATLNESFNNLASTVRYIKWIYTNKVNGNVALGNIRLAEYTPSTALEDVETSVKAVKVLRNGQLFIEKAGHIYNAMGQMVK